MSTMIYDHKNKQKLAAYAPGNGDLIVMWRNEDNSPADRSVTSEECANLCRMINEKERRAYRWYVSTCKCLRHD